MSTTDATLVLGAVAYDPKVVTIWTGFRTWFIRQGFPFDYVLYSHYERQVEDLLDGRIHVAWNSPLAWVRARRLAHTRGDDVTALAMRDTDRDLTSVVVVRSESPIRSLADLRGKTVGVGAVDSPQATLLPLAHIRASGLELGRDFEVHRFDVGVGLHGDHVGGERDAARALVNREVDAACMIDSNYLAFGRDGTFLSGSTRVLAQTAKFDHCNMTVSPSAPRALTDQFRDLLLGMSYADPTVRPLLDLEGLKAWCDGRISGYGPLEGAVDAARFYDPRGSITAHDYRP
ncbi:MAG TPA: phosphate/phosphite/phosphonate ABC transporter substrate-binding protein [Chloroflexota bacterium]|nr:phosphate/phosphite/phosphonate ABC transporter substrate-binding protein [Chloroflexota bacterium]